MIKSCFLKVCRLNQSNIDIATQRIATRAVVYTDNRVSINNAKKQNNKQNEKETQRRYFHIHYVEAIISKVQYVNVNKNCLS